MTETVKRKAKKIIKELDFSGENAAVSLVSTDVGGPANGVTVLLTKSKQNNISDDNQIIPEPSTVDSVSGTSDKNQEVLTEVTPPDSNVNKGKEMSKPDVAVVETVEKSQFEQLQKSLQEQAELLNKAQATIANFEKEKQEAIIKAKTVKISDVLADCEKQVTSIIVKAALELDSNEDFDAFVAAVSQIRRPANEAQQYMEKALQEEKGFTVNTDTQSTETDESGVARILKAKFKK